MRGPHSILSLVLALALAAGAAVHGARAAAMAMPMAMAWSAAAEPCEMCGGGGAGAEAAGQCALVCAGLTGVLADGLPVRRGVGDRPAPGAPTVTAGRFAGPEPDPPR